MRSNLAKRARWAVAIVIAVLAFYNLRDYPTSWFDEGVHIHVPKTVLRYGVYADRSSDGFRYFGPTLGVGPTVLMPIAGAYKVLGVGLVQARIVIVLYLLGALFLFYRFARKLQGEMFAAIALALLLSAPSVALLETGRQVLGEVPGLCFLIAGFLVWFSAEHGCRKRLTLAGVLFGAAAVTKYQNLIVLGPTLVAAAAANLIYYRRLRLRVFAWPAIVLGVVFGIWQVIFLVYLGPQTAAENLAQLRAVTAGAAAVFSPEVMARAVRELLSFRSYGGALPLALAYGIVCAVPRTQSGQRWAAIMLFVLINLTWYATASIGWPRYAFAGLAFASLPLAKFFVDAFRHLTEASDTAVDAGARVTLRGLRAAVAVWALFIIGSSLGSVVKPILRPPPNYPSDMARYLDTVVPKDIVVETWEQELGALTDHNYHYPPSRLLAVAVRHIWLKGPSPSGDYHPLDTEHPPYVVIGPFARWVGLYPATALARDYTVQTVIGPYELYRRIDAAGSMSSAY